MADEMKNIVHLCDCMDFMATLPDKAYELAIVDPPYGIGIGTSVGGANHLVKMGGTNLSIPKFIGGSMIQNPLTKNILNL